MDKNYVNNSIIISEVESIQEYTKWAKEIPYIPIKNDWEIRMVPPFGGAIVRFVVRRKGEEQKEVSVYLDCYSRLGAWNEPYWEIYPCKGDTYRCRMKDIEDLVDAIDFALGNKRIHLKSVNLKS